MFPTFFLAIFAASLSFAAAQTTGGVPIFISKAPFTSSNGSILDSNGTVFQYMGINWPAAADTMLPEGLNYQSVQAIVNGIKGAGFNSIRLTFAIEMIDQMYANNGSDLPFSTSVNQALGQNASTVLDAILKNNPTFTANTTRLEVFDAVAAECNKQGIYVHLDNHVSKAQWCCSDDDGNAWFGDTHFLVTNWQRGLAYMATHAANWPNAVSIGLRNELREPVNATAHPYGWDSWYTNMRAAADAVHTANPKLLIFMGGMDYDTTLGPVVSGEPVGSVPGNNLSSVPYQDKVVLELHNYSWDNTGTDCESLTKALDAQGFDAMVSNETGSKNVIPVVMSEIGYGQDTDEVSGWYATCLRGYLPARSAGWMVWSIAGSNYIRNGVIDQDDEYGVFSHDWSDFRNKTAFEMGIAKMINAS